MLTSKFYTLVFICGSVFYSVFNCKSVSRPNKKDNLSKIKYTINYPFFNKSVFKYFTDSMYIYYYDNEYSVVEKPVYKSLEVDNRDTIIYSTSYNYFCSKRGSSKCLLYKNNYNSTPAILSLDSLLGKGVIPKNFDIYPTLAFGKKIIDTLVDENIRFVNFIGIEKKGLDYYDTAKIYFDKRMKNIELSFSKQLDSIYESKLVSINLVFSPGYSKEFEIDVPERFTKISMQYETIINKDSIAFLIKKAKGLF